MLGLLAEMEGLPDIGAPALDLGRDVFMGHEFAAEVLEVGPDTVGPDAGHASSRRCRSCSHRPACATIVYSNDLPAGYGERMLLSAPMLSEVPNGLDPRHAALTEPMAVGLHAVNRSGIAAGDGAVVLGCGPVGLAVIAALGLRGIEPIVAADLSPARRSLASVDGRARGRRSRDRARLRRVDAGRAGPGSGRLRGDRRPGNHRRCPAGSAPLRAASSSSACACSPTRSRPFFGICKELSMQFVLGYDPMEFDASLRSIAEGEIDVAPMITGEVGLDGAPGAFARAGGPRATLQGHSGSLTDPTEALR